MTFAAVFPIKNIATVIQILTKNKKQPTKTTNTE
jgi:hypothetical protein